LGSSLPKCLDQCTVNEQETQLKWFPLELGTGAGDQKHYNNGARGLRKKFDDIFSGVNTMHLRDRQTPDDGKDCRTYVLSERKKYKG